ncbi:unnamed protein product, partial [Medioppia subpectinata]
MEIRAMTSIAIGEEITISSIPLHMNRIERQRILNFALIVCHCDKCRLHLDKDIDYQEFWELLRKHEKQWKTYKALNFVHMNFNYEMDSNFMAYLESIYGEFHPSVTFFLLCSFICFANNSSNHSLIKLWFKRIERHFDLIISSKPYIAGDVIFNFNPLISCVKHEYKGKLCDNCLKPMDQLKRCAKCLQMYYCGKNCQTIDWSFHKNECKAFRGKTISDFDSLFLLTLRLYLRIKNDKTFATERHTFIDGSDVCLNDIKVNVKSSSFAKSLVYLSISKQFRSLGIDFEAKTLHRCYDLMSENNYSLVNNSSNPMDFDSLIGSSICLELWPISHSCLPNTAFVRKDEWIEIRAMKSIAIGEEITMALIALYMNGVERREQLKILHLDKDIDYQHFDRLLDKETIHWNSSKCECLRHLNFTYEMDSNFALYLETIYGGFHPIVSEFLLKSFICFANSMKTSPSLLNVWFKRIERHEVPLRPNSAQDMSAQIAVNTSKGFSAGDVIIQTKPMVHIICNEFKGLFCDNCLKREDQLRRCLKCLQMYYCGKMCQMNDWKYHKNECKVLRHTDFHRELFSSEEILLLRLYLSLKSDESFATKRYKLMDGSDVCLKEIIVEKDTMYSDCERMLEFNRVCMCFNAFGIKLSDFQKRHELFNWFAFLSSSPSHVGLKWYSRDMKDCQYFSDKVCRAVSLEMSSLNHSCLPNSAIVTNGKTLSYQLSYSHNSLAGLSVQLRALKEIPIGEEITVSFIRLDKSKSDRREALKNDFYVFDCKCLKCELNLDSGIDYNAFDELIAEEILNFVDKRRIDPNSWSEYDSLSSKLIPYYEAIYGNYHPFLTATLMQQSMTSRMSAMIASEPAFKWKPMLLDYYKTVDQHLRITHGVDHPLPNSAEDMSAQIAVNTSKGLSAGDLIMLCTYFYSISTECQIIPINIVLRENSNTNVVPKVAPDSEWSELIANRVAIYSAFLTEESVVRITSLVDQECGLIAVDCHFREHTSSRVIHSTHATVKVLVGHYRGRLKYAASQIQCQLPREYHSFAHYVTIDLPDFGSTGRTIKVRKSDSYKNPSNDLRTVMCVMPLYNTGDMIANLVEFMAYYTANGIERYVFYDWDSDPRFRSLVLSMNFTQILPFKMPIDGLTIHSWGQMASTNDCLLRHSNSPVILVDMDEFIVVRKSTSPDNSRTIQSLIVREMRDPSVSSLLVNNRFLCREYQIRHTFPRILSHTRLQSYPWSPNLRSKVIVLRPNRVIDVWVHAVYMSVEGFHMKVMPDTDVLMYHYRCCRGMNQVWLVWGHYVLLYFYSVRDQFTDDKAMTAFETPINRFIAQYCSSYRLFTQFLEPVFEWKPMLLDYYKTVDQHLRITHGVDHPLLHFNIISF